jgi:hypothetical protein
LRLSVALHSAPPDSNGDYRADQEGYALCRVDCEDTPALILVPEKSVNIIFRLGGVSLPATSGAAVLLVLREGMESIAISTCHILVDCRLGSVALAGRP